MPRVSFFLLSINIENYGNVIFLYAFPLVYTYSYIYVLSVIYAEIF